MFINRNLNLRANTTASPCCHIYKCIFVVGTPGTGPEIIFEKIYSNNKNNICCTVKNPYFLLFWLKSLLLRVKYTAIFK